MKEHETWWKEEEGVNSDSYGEDVVIAGRRDWEWEKREDAKTLMES